jgi:hypothetical protein
MGVEEKDPPWVEKKTLSDEQVTSRLVRPRRSALVAMAAVLASGNAACASNNRGDDKDPSDGRGQGRSTDRDSGDARGGSRPAGFYGMPQFNVPINGKVGLPLDVNSVATCEGGGWNARIEIVSGALPPGLTLYQEKLGIRGVPTRAGTWYLRVRWSGLTCAGKSYDDVTQDLAIVTEGSSAPSSVR